MCSKKPDLVFAKYRCFSGGGGGGGSKNWLSVRTGGGKSKRTKANRGWEGGKNSVILGERTF